MTIKAILFDKDGTLIDVTGTWVPAYREMLAELFGADARRVEELLIAGGYDPAKGGFRAGSTLAGGTTRELIDIWWPGLDGDVTSDRSVVVRALPQILDGLLARAGRSLLGVGAPRNESSDGHELPDDRLAARRRRGGDAVARVPAPHVATVVERAANGERSAGGHAPGRNRACS